MKLSFKQFLSEIDVDDRNYTKAQSSHTIKRVADAENLKEVPFREKISGFTAYWRENKHGDFDIVLKDDKTKAPAIVINTSPKEIRTVAGTLHALVVDVLSSAEEYRGQGLAFKLYHAMVKSGQVLMSSNQQTKGSVLLWQKLARSDAGEAMVAVYGDRALHYADRDERYADKYFKPWILLTGPFDELNDAAYETTNNHWIILPSDMGMIDDIKKSAVSLSEE